MQGGYQQQQQPAQQGYPQTPPQGEVQQPVSNFAQPAAPLGGAGEEAAGEIGEEDEAEVGGEDVEAEPNQAAWGFGTENQEETAVDEGGDEQDDDA